MPYKLEKRSGIQLGGAAGTPPTASGWPTYYAEEAVGMAHVFQSQLTSLVAEEYVTSRAGEIIRCPWHGWEFDLQTGQSWFDPHAVRVRRYDVSVEPGAVLLSEAEPAAPPPAEAGTTPSEIAAAGGGEPDAAMGGRAKGPYVAETYPVVVEQEYVIVDTGRRRS